NDVLLTRFGRALLNKSVTGMIKAHRYARHFLGEELDIEITHRIVKALAELDLAPARIDLGRLVEKLEGPNADIEAFLAEELAEAVGSQAGKGGVRDIVLYGFVRVGRHMARMLIGRSGRTGTRLPALVVRPKGEHDIVRCASLLRRASVHGVFAGSIVVDEDANTIQANGTL